MLVKFPDFTIHFFLFYPSLSLSSSPSTRNHRRRLASTAAALPGRRSSLFLGLPRAPQPPHHNPSGRFSRGALKPSDFSSRLIAVDRRSGHFRPRFELLWTRHRENRGAYRAPVDIDQIFCRVAPVSFALDLVPDLSILSVWSIIFVLCIFPL